MSCKTRVHAGPCEDFRASLELRQEEHVHQEPSCLSFLFFFFLAVPILALPLIGCVNLEEKCVTILLIIIIMMVIIVAVIYLV